MPPANIFVIGMDETNLDTLRDVPGAQEYRFHPLLSVEELQHGEIPVADLMERAQAGLDAFDGTIDAIVGYWDFPVSTMVPILCERYGLRGTSLESVVKCEHKYWSRLEQQKVIDEHPAFGIVDLDDPRPPAGVGFPMWLKPVKSFSSELAFHVAGEEDFREAVAEIRAGVSRVGRPFEYFLDRLDLPPEVAVAGGQACLAEAELPGVQAAVEGYAVDGEVVVYGALDSINYPDSSAFLRHQYPSSLPEPVLRRMEDVAKRVISRIGLDSATFSIEFFYDPDSGAVNLLEINPRHSQSHAELFDYVDGVPNHHCMLALALGRDPRMPHRRGRYELAAKWYHRRFEDGVVRRVPTPEEIARLEREIPGVKVDIVPEVGTRLSDMPGQDSYSYELAHVFVGADDEAGLKDKYERCVAALPFEFADPDRREEVR
ncbi:ATP-grasp domain-containing protein [Marinactinospora thermotolerans]|uniref:D-alanine-D-alanine ligase and related ATP-grasp enzymes n=1 Tax=Marinactinospora thermotolerans DSM 45154 TaxID=1122192 RepID=A0A1T4NNT1_9ACTN|nr:D-alanine-D-alanine ligase and related ATP-grasp enzymes [Marinactinospora thermotolerans DSM 45154]